MNKFEMNSKYGSSILTVINHNELTNFDINVKRTVDDWGQPFDDIGEWVHIEFESAVKLRDWLNERIAKIEERRKPFNEFSKRI